MSAGTDNQASNRASDRLIGTTLAGRYDVIGRLGKGGAGHVYLALQQPLGREVAVKVLRADLHPVAQREFSARFLREAEAIAALRHPNVVTVFDFGVDETAEGELQFVVMERLRGERLTDRMNRGPMPPFEVARLGAGIARGLRHAHGKGLVHRDVKPSNIILEPGDDGVRPILLDFGLVKPTGDDSDEEDLTKVGTYMGTPAYMAPEQAKGDGSVDPRTDVYALGCVLFKMLAGVAPYTGKNPLALALAHTTEPVPTMFERNPDVVTDEDLEAIIVRCIQKRPADRWPDAAALADALEDWKPASERTAVTRVPVKQSRVPLVLGVLGLGLFGIGGLGISGAAVWMAGVGQTQVEPEDITLGPPVAEAPADDGAADAVPDEDAEADGSDSADRALADEGDGDEDPEADEVLDVVEPDPSAAPEPAPAPTPRPAASAPAPKPAPTRVTAPRPAPAEATTADGVDFDAAHAGRALAWINQSDEGTLRSGGILGRQVNIILEQRPFASLESFAATPYIGPKTVESVHRSTAQ